MKLCYFVADFTVCFARDFWQEQFVTVSDFLGLWFVPLSRHQHFIRSVLLLYKPLRYLRSPAVCHLSRLPQLLTKYFLCFVIHLLHSAGIEIQSDLNFILLPLT